MWIVLEIENIGDAVKMLLLSCIQAETCVISHLLPVTGRHLRFLIHPDKRQYFKSVQ